MFKAHDLCKSLYPISLINMESLNNYIYIYIKKCNYKTYTYISLYIYISIH